MQSPSIKNKSGLLILNVSFNTLWEDSKTNSAVTGCGSQPGLHYTRELSHLILYKANPNWVLAVCLALNYMQTSHMSPQSNLKDNMCHLKTHCSASCLLGLKSTWKTAGVTESPYPAVSPSLRGHHHMKDAFLVAEEKWPSLHQRLGIETRAVQCRPS